jgi:hypothetical protein
LILLAFLSVTAAAIMQRIRVFEVNAHQGTPIHAKPAPGVDPRAAVRTLSPTAQAQVSSVIGKDLSAYHFVAGPDGLRMTNAGRGVTAEFTQEGVSFRNGADEWGMDLRAYGHGDRLRNAQRTSPGGAANRVEYRRGAVTEWYVNGPKGLEQGFTLERRPTAASGTPLTLAFEMSGNLAASVDPGGRSLSLRKDRSSALRYSGLTALDANGHELPAWLEVSGKELRIRVDDAGARYPLTIDPYVQATTLTTVMPCDPAGVCDDGAWFDHFGYTVSVSADASTVVVGVPYKYTNSIARGAAYVFVKPDDFAGGWNSGVRFKTKLLASDGATNGLHLAYSVDISGDGGTIVAGAPALSFSGAAPPSGAAYVFLRPAGGWGSFAVQTENARLAPAPQSGVDNRGSFGTSVAISSNGGAIAAGAPDMRVAGIHYGATYVFLKPAVGWVNTSETQRIQGAAGSYHGSSVAWSDDASTLVAGATGENLAGGAPDDTGAAHVFVRNPGLAASYLAAARLTPSDGVPYDIFGWTITMSGNGTTVVVGAPGDSSDTIRPHGAAYVFVKPPAGWGGPASSLTETAKLTTSDGGGNDSLGASVDISLDGNTIAASTFKGQNNPSAPQNGVYFFAKPAAGWSDATEDTKVMSPGAIGDWFGWSTSLSGNGAVAVAGAPGTEINANLFQGAAYVFTGAAPTPRASVSPASLTFASRPIGTTSAPQTVTVTNSGSAPLHVTNVGVTGHFTTTQNCKSASPIAPGSSCAESVVFKPFSVGAISGTLTFTDNSGGTAGAVQTVQLQGSGETGNTTTTIVSLSPNPVFVNTSTLVAASVSAGNFSVSGPVTIQASTGETCTSGGDSNGCFLTFFTLGPRTVTATYNGNNSLNGSTSPGVLVLAIDFSISASPTSQSVSGRKATYKVTVTGQGQFAGPVAMGCVGGPAGSTCAVSPASVSLSGPTADAKATVTVPAGAAPGTYTITFSGTFGGVTRLAAAKLIVK